MIFADDAHPRISRECIQNRRQVSAGAIIDHDELDFPVGLLQHALDRLVEKLRLVPHRQDNAHQRAIGGIALEAG